MLFVILILALLVIYFLFTVATSTEGFQTFKVDNKYLTFDYVPVKEKDKILSIPVLNYNECLYLCKTTPNCDGVNYALNNCTMYNYTPYS